MFSHGLLPQRVMTTPVKNHCHLTVIAILQFLAIRKCPRNLPRDAPGAKGRITCVKDSPISYLILQTLLKCTFLEKKLLNSCFQAGKKMQPVSPLRERERQQQINRGREFQDILNLFLNFFSSRKSLMSDYFHGYRFKNSWVTSWLRETERYNSSLLAAQQTLHSVFLCTFTQVIACTYTALDVKVTFKFITCLFSQLGAWCFQEAAAYSINSYSGLQIKYYCK